MNTSSIIKLERLKLFAIAFTLVFTLVLQSASAFTEIACDPDIEDPVITCTSNKVGVLDENCFFELPDYTLEITATDDCDLDVEITQSPAPGTLINSFTSITFTATDDTGNFSTCSIQISLTDQTDPTIICPSDIAVNANTGTCEANIISDFPTINDNCGIDFYANSHNGSIDASDVYSVGETEVIWTAVDLYTNASSCSQFITVNDNEPPTITCPPGIVASVDLNCAFTIPDYTSEVTATDNCDPSPLVTQSPIFGTIITSDTTVWIYATDIFNNIDSCSISIDLVDLESPSISCPDDVAVNTDLSQCSSNILMSEPMVSDNCVLDYYTNDFNNTDNASGVYPSGSTTVNWTVYDESGNSETCFQVITVSDNEAPEIECPEDKMEFYDTNCGFELEDYISESTATDNCDVDLTYTQLPPSGTIVYSDTEITITASDDALNESFCTFQIILSDTIAPTITCNDDIIQATDSNVCEATVTVNQPIVLDNCDIDYIENDLTGTDDASGIYPLGTTSVIWTVYDLEGNNSSCTQNITIEDTEVPTIECPDDLSANTEFNQCSSNVIVSAPVISDNCVLDYYTNDFNNTDDASGVYPSGSTTVNWTVYDESGNSETCFQVITVSDNEAPEIECPEDKMEFYDTNCGFELEDYISESTATDNCDVDLTYTQLPPSGTIVYSDTEITITASDDALNESFCTFQIILSDTIAPTITCNDDIIQATDSNVCEATVTVNQPIVLDNCDIDYIENDLTGTDDASGIYPLGTTSVIWTVYDLEGNNSSCTQNITIEDTEVPTIECPDDLSANTEFNQCSSNVIVSAPVISDNCVLDYYTNDFNNTDDASGVYPIGTTTVNWTVYDESGNSETCFQVITVSDNEAPEIECPEDKMEFYDTNCGFELEDYISESTATDNCDVDLTFTQLPPSGTIVYSDTEITITASDDALNESFCTFQIILSDTIAPTITCNDDIIQATDSNVCEATVTVNQPIVLDNCTLDYFDNNITGTTDASGIYAIGTTSVVWTAYDLEGNSSSCIQTITINDLEAPSIECPDNKYVDADENCFYEIPDYTSEIISIDNCDVSPEIIQDPVPGTMISGINTITFTSTDNSGNSNSCTILIVVQDVTIPEITCPNDTTVFIDSGLCEATITLEQPLVNDNCFADSAENDYNFTTDASDTYPKGVTPIVWTAIDSSDNINTCTQVVTVIDNEGPEIICTADQILYSDINCEATLVDYTSEIDATDICGGEVIIVQSPAPGTLFSNEITVTFTAIDEDLNESSCNIIVSSLDTIQPELICPENIFIENDIDECSAFVSIPFPESTDNCSAVSLINDYNGTSDASDIYPVGTTEITWTGTDISGNTNTCTVQVNVTDTQSPDILCPENQEVVGDENCEALLPDFSELLEITDNCSVDFTVLQSPVAGTIFEGEIEVSFTVEDEFLNSSICTFTTSVIDTLSPQIICNDTIFASTELGLCESAVLVSPPTGSDNCDLYTITNNITGTEDASGTYLEGINEILWTITDSSGNSNTCTQIILVEDFEAPIITCMEDKTVYANDLCVFELPDYTAELIATDNCDLELEFSQSPAPGMTISGISEITFYAIDNYLNIDSCSITINVLDTISPIITCQPDITINTLEDECDALVSITSPTISDNCGAFTYSNNINGTISASGFYDLGSTEITWTAIDTAGNESVCVQTINVLDNQIPEIVCTPDKVVYADQNCQFEIPDYTNEIVAIDNCDSDVDITQSPEVGTLVEGFSFMTFTATDNSGNSSTCSILISILDTIPPTIICPNDTIVNTEIDNCSTFIDLGLPSIADNCGTFNYSNDYNFTNDASDTYSEGTTTIIWTAVDDSGNINTCNQIITVVDNQAPSITCPDDKLVFADENCQFEMIDYTSEVIVLDNCDPEAVITQSPEIGTLVSDTIEVTFTVTDASSNVSFCSIELIVLDTIAPLINCPENIITGTDQDLCSAYINIGAPEVLDNCNQVVYTNNFNFTDNASDTYPIGTTEVIWTVTDNSNNSSTCSQWVTVEDDQMPFIVCPEDQIVSADENCQFELIDFTDLIVSTDNCDTDIEITQIPVAGTFVSGISELTFYATDNAGNVNECTIQIIIEDIINPTIIAYQSDTIIDSGLDCEYILEDFTVSIEAFDNCDLELIYSQLPEPGTVLDEIENTYAIQLFATDNSGNFSIEEFNIYLTDTIAPIINCPADITANASLNACSAYILSPVPSKSDNCGAVTITNNFNGTNNANGSYPSGTTEVVWTATDQYNNTSTCVQNMTVIDTNTPIIYCAPDVVLEALIGECEVTSNILPAVAIDNCETTNLTNNINNTDDATGTYPVGITEITWTVEDSSGNASSCVQLVTVVDLVGPEITCPNDTIIYTDAVTCDSYLELPVPVVIDDCGYEYLINDYNDSNNASDIFSIGTVDITWDVADQYGNTNQCVQNVTLIDSVTPVFTCVDTLLTSFFEDTYPLDPYELIIEMDDNCLVDTTTFTTTLEIIEESVVGINDVVMTVEDVNGNLSTCISVVEVLFDQEPVALCPPTLDIYLDETGNYNLSLSEIDLGSYDNNELVSLTIDQNDFDCSDILTENSITLTAIDNAGLVGTCITELTVLDTLIPVLECQDAVVYLNQEGQHIMSDELIISVEENCTEFIISHEIEIFDCSLIGENTIEVYATDMNANQAVCVANVTVIDNLSPVIISCEDINYFSTSDTTCGEWINMNEIQLPDFDENCNLASATSSYFNDYTGLDINFVNPPDTSFYFELTDAPVTWVLEDNSGNISECESSFVVVDNTAPTVIVDPEIVLFFPEDVCDFTYSFTLTEDHLYDNCGIGGFTETQDQYFDGPGTEIFAFYAVDINGNEIEVFPTQEIIVIDTIAPEINCQDTLTFYSSIESCFAEIEVDPNMFITDACTDNLVISESFTTSYGPGYYEHTWDVADQGTLDLINYLESSEENLFSIEINEFGQAVFQDTLTFDFISTCTQIIEVLDTIAPWSFAFEDNIEILTITEPIDVELNIPEFLDNCQVDSIYINDLEENYLDSISFTDSYTIGSHTIIWTVVDIFGNESEFQTILEIIDNGAPEFEDCIETFEIFVNNNCQYTVPDFTEYFTIIDNIEDIITVTQSIEPGEVLTENTDITITAQDLLGNIGLCSFELIPIDTLAPNLECQETIYACSSLMDFQFPNYFDNCDNVTETDVLVGDITYDSWSILETGILTDTVVIEFFGEDFSGNIGSCISTYIPLEDSFMWNFETTEICANETIDLSPNTDFYTWETSLENSSITDGIYTGSSAENFNQIDVVTLTVCDVEFEQSIEVIAYPEIELFADNQICLEDTIHISSEISLYTSVNWSLSSSVLNLENISNSDAIITTDGSPYENENITITIEADNNGCITTDINEIAIFESPNNYDFSAGADIDLFNENEVTLNGMYGGPGLVHWNVIQSTGSPSISDINSLTPTIENISLGYYVFELEVENGNCPLRNDSITVFNNITIPNGISPDMNGIGDYFEITGLLNSDKEYELTIINRWGNIVYESKDYRNDWYGLNQNGDPLLEGTYYYLLTNGEQVYSNFVIIKYE